MAELKDNQEKREEEEWLDFRVVWCFHVFVVEDA